MKQLQKEIARLEREIEANNEYINTEYSMLKNSVHNPTFILSIGIVSCFVLGFVIAREKKPTKIMKRLINMASTTNNMYKNIKPFL